VSQGGGVLPAWDSELRKWIIKDFGSIDALMSHFNQNTGAV